jgi:glycosyltransferase 2 family protein
MMGSGLALAAALAPLLFGLTQLGAAPRWIRPLIGNPVLPGIIVTGLCGLLLPMLSLVLTRVAVRMTPRDLLAAHGPAKIDSLLLGAGLLAFAVGWGLHGLSLGLTLRAVSDVPLRPEDWPMWTAAVALATVVGFLAVFAPGGLGVREGLLIAALSVQPHIGNQEAITAAVFLRIVWFTAEILAATVLYYSIRPRPRGRGSHPSLRRHGWRDLPRSSRAGGVANTPVSVPFRVMGRGRHETVN